MHFISFTRKISEKVSFLIDLLQSFSSIINLILLPFLTFRYLPGLGLGEGTICGRLTSKSQLKDKSDFFPMCSVLYIETNPAIVSNLKLLWRSRNEYEIVGLVVEFSKGKNRCFFLSSLFEDSIHKCLQLTLKRLHVLFCNCVYACRCIQNAQSLAFFFYWMHYNTMRNYFRVLLLERIFHVCKLSSLSFLVTKYVSRFIPEGVQNTNYCY